MMRTTITISDQLLKDLMRFTKASSKTEGVNKALADWVRWHKIKELKKLHGKLTIEGNLNRLRTTATKKLKDLNE